MPTTTVRTPCLSMTGYANGQAEFAGGRIAFELRSVNSRFLDLQFRIPDELRIAEPPLREMLTSAIARGKVECRIALQRADALADTSQAPDPQVLARLAQWQAQVQATMPQAQPLSVGEVLRWPGVIADTTPDPQALQEAVMKLARQGLDQFIESRTREGQRLAQYILERVDRIQAIVDDLHPRLPLLREAYRRKVTERLSDALGLATTSGTGVMSREEVAARLAGEATLFGTRSDVDEELTRLETHLREVRRVLGADAGAGGNRNASKGGIGKRLDFLMQELNREANTLGSKAVAVELSEASVEAKLLIEQIREQVQNLE